MRAPLGVQYTLPPPSNTAKMNSLPYTLTAEQSALFEGLQDSAIFPGLAIPGEGELVALFKKNSKERNRNLHEPYADLLKTHILAKIRADRAAFLDTLKASPSMSAEVFSWYTISYTQTLTELKRARIEMTPDERIRSLREEREAGETVADNHWETLVSVVQEQDTGDVFTNMWDAKVNNVFRYTDLADRVAMALGPCFSSYTTWERAEGLPSSEMKGFIVFKRSLCVRYSPFGLNLEQMRRLFEAAKRQNERSAKGEIHMLKYYEDLKISPPAKDPYADMPSLIPAGSVSLLGGKHTCFCGCNNDE